VNKEFDNNAAHTHPSYADPQLSGYGLANNFGQPSVVYRVPIHLDVAAGAAAAGTTSEVAGYSDWTGGSGTILARDATISTDDPGSGEGRLLEIATAAGTGRLHVQVQPCGTTACTPPPPAPSSVSDVAATKDGLTDKSAVVTFRNAQSEGGGAIASYEIRYREGDSMTDDEFVEAIRAPQVTPGAPGSTASLTLTGLKPATDYVVGVRAVDACGQTSPLAQTGFATPTTPFKKVEGCFVATAAWGSALASQVEALRRARDRARSGNAMVAVAVDLYYRAGPPAAAVLRRSDSARAAVRMLLSPAASTATVLF
jgi:hypothetical protein